MQLNIFSAMYPRYKIDKPIRLYTLFSGYDSQALALKYLGVEFEHYKTCEWAVNSIQALKDLHFKQDHTDYSAPHTHTHTSLRCWQIMASVKITTIRWL